MKPPFFHRLKTHVYFEIDSYRQRLRKLRSCHFPSDVALDFIRLLEDELRLQREAIEGIVREFDLDAIGAGQRLQSEHRKLVALLVFF